MMGILFLLFWFAEPPAYVRPATFTPEFWVVVDEDYENARQLKAREVFEIAPGRRTVRFMHPRHTDQVFPVVLSPGDTLDIAFSMPPLRMDRNGSSSSYLRMFTDGNVLINTDEDTAVMLGNDTLRVGSGYILLPTAYDQAITLVSASGYTKQLEVQSSYQAIRVIEAYLRPDRITTRWMAIIPGGGAYHKREYLKAGLLGVSGVTSVGYAIVLWHQTANHIASYDEAVKAYNQSTIMQTAIYHREQALRRKSMADESALRRDLMFGLAGGLLLYNVWDAFQPPKSGFRSTHNAIDFMVNPTGVGLKINFR